MKTDKILTTREVAEKLGVSISRVHKLIKAGRLPSQQFGRDHIIKESDLVLVTNRKMGRPVKQASVSPKSAIPAGTKKPSTRGKLIVVGKVERKLLKRSHPNLPPLTKNPDVMGGIWVLAGTRIPIATVLDELMIGTTIDEFVKGHPSVTAGDVVDALRQLRDWLSEDDSIVALWRNKRDAKNPVALARKLRRNPYTE